MNTDLLSLVSHGEVSVPRETDSTVTDYDGSNEHLSTDNTDVNSSCQGDISQTLPVGDKNFNCSATEVDLNCDLQKSKTSTKETEHPLGIFTYHDNKEDTVEESALLLSFDANANSLFDDNDPDDSENVTSSKQRCIHIEDLTEKDGLLLNDSCLDASLDDAAEFVSKESESICQDQSKQEISINNRTESLNKETVNVIEKRTCKDINSIDNDTADALPKESENLSEDQANKDTSIDNSIESVNNESENLNEELTNKDINADNSVDCVTKEVKNIEDDAPLSLDDNFLIQVAAKQEYIEEQLLSENASSLEDESTIMITGVQNLEVEDKDGGRVTLLNLTRGDKSDFGETETDEIICIPRFKSEDKVDDTEELIRPTTTAGIEQILDQHSSDEETEPKSAGTESGDIAQEPDFIIKDDNIRVGSDTDGENSDIADIDEKKGEDLPEEDKEISVNVHPFHCHVDVASVKYPASYLAKERKKKKNESHLKESEDHVRYLLIRQNVKHLKSFLRTSLWAHDHQMRGLLWQQACKYLHKAGGDFYEEMEDELYNRREQTGDVSLPALVDFDNLPSYHLNTEGIQTVHKILGVIHHTNPDITYCPTLFALVSVFLHYMTPSDTYNCAYGLLRSKETFIMQTKVSFEASKMVVRDLAKKYVKSAYVNLVRNSNNVDAVFDSFYWWIFRDLPFPHLVCIIDCFILEGLKVFYRAALAILILYAKQPAQTKRSRRQGAVVDPVSSIRQFCRDFPYRTDKLLRTGFGIRGLTRKHIKKLQVKNQMIINSRQLHQSASSHSMNGRRRANSGPSTIQLPSSTVLSQDMPTERSRSVGRLLFLKVTSAIVTPEELYTVWSWLPPRFAVCQPELLYTSEEHGTSLMTLYTRVQDHQPTLIVIKTTNDEVFGAFCSTYWRDRKYSTKNLSYFGTGETFIFTLSPDKHKYPWVGLQQQEIPNTANMFLAGDNSMLTVGGGNGEAIQLDANLLHCRTEKCDTFHNDPLCPGEDFTCKVVEVYGFV